MQGPDGQNSDSEFEYYYEEDEDAGYELRNPEDIKKLIEKLRAGGSAGFAVPPPPPSSSGSGQDDAMVTPPSTDRYSSFHSLSF